MAAMKSVSFIPSFVSFTTQPKVEQTSVGLPVKAFNTSRTGQDRMSKAVTVEYMHYDEVTKSIKVVGSDGLLRECRTGRLPSIEHGRNLWKKVARAGKEKKSIQFVAAGGFSPDKWFYDIEEA